VEPFATLAAERGLANKWRGFGEIRSGLEGGAVFYGPGLTEEQPELGQRWMTAYLQGVRAYGAALRNGERDAVAAVLARYTALRDVSLYDRIALPSLDPNGRIEEATVIDLLGWYVAQGLVPAAVEPQQAIDSRFVAGAVQRLGRQK